MDIPQTQVATNNGTVNVSGNNTGNITISNNGIELINGTIAHNGIGRPMTYTTLHEMSDRLDAVMGNYGSFTSGTYGHPYVYHAYTPMPADRNAIIDSMHFNSHRIDFDRELIEHVVDGIRDQIDEYRRRYRAVKFIVVGKKTYECLIGYERMRHGVSVRDLKCFMDMTIIVDPTCAPLGYKVLTDAFEEYMFSEQEGSEE